MTGAKSGTSVIGTRCQIDIDGDGRYTWRLTASNGRVIALGASAYPDERACRSAFAALCGPVEGLAGGVQHSGASNGWIWRLRDAAGRPQAESARAYERHSTCQAAYDRFRLLLLNRDGTRDVVWGGAG